MRTGVPVSQVQARRLCFIGIPFVRFDFALLFHGTFLVFTVSLASSRVLRAALVPSEV